MVSQIVLHSYRRCPFAIRVRMTLEEKGIPYTCIEEDLSNLSPELLRLHPEGKVPLLIHSGMAIHESSIITEYLDEISGSPYLMPAGALHRAQTRLWTYWCNELLKPDLDQFKYEWASLSEDGRSILVERIRGHLSRLTKALAVSAFLMGDQLTLADIHIFPFYRQLQKANSEFSRLFETQKVDEWLNRITSRPSFDRVMRKATQPT